MTDLIDLIGDHPLMYSPGPALFETMGTDPWYVELPVLFDGRGTLMVVDAMWMQLNFERHGAVSACSKGRPATDQFRKMIDDDDDPKFEPKKFWSVGDFQDWADKA